MTTALRTAANTHSALARINRAFMALQYDGWFAAPNWKCCQGHGFDAAIEKKPDAKGFAFYAEKSKRCFDPQGNIVKPVSIYYAAGDCDTFLSDKAAGEFLLATLHANGLRVSWNGDPDKALSVTGTGEVM